ncbi:MAG: L-ribulose-5-phosphate 4-epimerase, partial [Bombilactobacillus sp.]
SLQLTRANIELPQYLLDKHYYRKHGQDAYYGQNNAQSQTHARHEK